MIKVSGLRHKRANQRDTMMDWLIFQKVYLMYYDIKNKEARNYVIIITSMSNNIQANKEIKIFKTHGVRLKKINL